MVKEIEEKMFNIFYGMCFTRFEQVNSLPSTSGVYILEQDGRIYCGCTTNLKARVNISARLHNIKKNIYFFPTNFIQYDGKAVPHKFLELIEKETISALMTISYGNGLPLDIVNQKDCLLLPASAWGPSASVQAEIGINIAKSIIYRIGFLERLTQLPAYESLITDFPRVMYRFVCENMKCLLKEERERRQNCEDPDPFMCLLHWRGFVDSTGMEPEDIEEILGIKKPIKNNNKNKPFFTYT